MPDPIDDFPEFTKWYHELKGANKVRVKIGLMLVMMMEEENLPMNLAFNNDGRGKITYSSTKLCAEVLNKLLPNNGVME